ncbi:hypothetical protein N7494_004704 [Penicillium frequentans]|uniref:Azaphilone pigments biosynthesis cluster protein L N-terminal domain-containing protein n=1 Tax=Penicillium frequentans TaxID=3151616 RepID=A0AAD6D293_9EURO|nr:hypothetical protein N7494_004704 [Penicillium glabrum]
MRSFRNRETSIRDLRDALQDLNEVLSIFRESISFPTCEIIERPLGRYFQACNDFKALIMSYSVHSNDDRFSICDWAKLRYIGENVVGFQTMIPGYKSTLLRLATPICMLFLFVVLYLTKTTKNVIDEYNNLIKDTRRDFELHLQSIENILKSLFPGESVPLKVKSINIRIMDEETESTQHGPENRDQVSAYINSAEKVVIDSRVRLLQHHHERGTRPPLLQNDDISQQN